MRAEKEKEREREKERDLEREKERQREREREKERELQAETDVALVAAVEPEAVTVSAVPPRVQDKMRPTRLITEETHPFQCPQCRARFPHYAQLSHHLAYLHRARPMQLECATCKAIFSNEQALHEHKRVHESNGEHKTHKCPQCDFASAFASNLRAHTLARHTSA